MSHTEYSAQFVQYSSVFLGLEEALCVNRRVVWERRISSMLQSTWMYKTVLLESGTATRWDIPCLLAEGSCASSPMKLEARALPMSGGSMSH